MKDKGEPQVAHLSSIDAMVLAVTMCEEYLVAYFGLSNESLEQARIETLSLRAGSKPLEDISAVALSLLLVQNDPVSESCCVSTFEIGVGPLHVIVQIRHEPPSPRWFHVDEVRPLEERSSIYRRLFRETSHSSTPDSSSISDDSIAYRHDVVVRSEQAPSGIEAASWPKATFIDSLVLAAQMAEVLIYSSGGTSRDASGTLWMRQVSFAVTSSSDFIGMTDAATLQLVRSRDLVMPERTFRSLDVKLDSLFGVRFRSSLAYEVR